MILIRKGHTNTITLTLTEKCDLPSPYFLFCFTNELSGQEINIILTDHSLFTERYNRFTLVEPSTANFTEGYWLYEVYEQTTTTTIKPATGLVEQGKMKVIDETASTETIYEPTTTPITIYN